VLLAMKQGHKHDTDMGCTLTLIKV